MRRLLIVALILTVAFSGCIVGRETQPSPEELKTLVLESLKNLSTYRYTIDSTQRVEMVNLLTNASNLSEVTIVSTGDGAFNLTAHEISFVQRLNISSDKKIAAPIESETYLINDTVYTKRDRNWTKIGVRNYEELWSSQNTIENQAELLNHSDIELQGFEKVGGQKCYKMKIKPDMRTYATVLSEQAGPILPLSRVNFTTLFQNSSMEWTSWITKDSNLLKRNDIAVEFTLTPDMLGLSANEIGSFEIRVNASATTLYKDFNQPVAVTLPAEARSARVQE